MKLEIINSISAAGKESWNRLAGTDYPFLRFEFLGALENHGCVGEEHGWVPRHLLAVDEKTGTLAGAVPMYLKDNSYGEFVFDWAWAEAYQRVGLAYYPKSVVSIPYTPATGPRMLIGNIPDREEVANNLVELARRWSESEQLSSLHWLFTDHRDTQRLAEQGFMLRLGCQFHWQNDDYRDFDHYLSFLTARKRKKIKRERRYVEDAGIDVEVVHGCDATDEQIAIMHRFYQTTFEKKWGYPTLTHGFFSEIAETMGEQLVFFIALRDEKPVAGSICFRSNDTLYGRHWGCDEDYHSLHFETCYYQGIEYCIRHGLRYFEPGAQGEHKISRGFLPTKTWSAHWIGDAQFRNIIERFLEHETEAMQQYIRDLSAHSPFRKQETG